MKIIKLSNDIDKDRLLKHIGSTKAGSEIMKDKMNLNFFYLKDIRTPAANILKQDALSIGAEVVVPKAAAACESRFVDALLIANDTQLKILHKKEKLQPFGLKKLADNLFDFIDTLDFKTKIMGVINANEDSFYEGSRFKGKEAIKKIEQMMLGGADIIDIGGVSSRPGSKSVDEEEELLRIKPIVDEIYATKLYERIYLQNLQ